jgi:lipopolysaccharide/colanic/teichoic acid biosynthesis glycosyltransferase
MDALILAGGHGTDLQPLTLQRPKHLLPIANRPALSYTIEALRRAGFLDIGLTVNGDESHYREALGDGSLRGVRLTFLRETAPKGTAGCLRAVLDDPRQGRLLVMSGNVFYSGDLRGLTRSHEEWGAVATIGIVPAPVHSVSRRPQREHLRMGSNGALLDYSLRYASTDEGPQWRPAGIYVFEREALERIPINVYCDLKEQLLPGLVEEGLPVFTYLLGGDLTEIDWAEEYLRAQFDVLRGRAPLPPPGEELIEGVWAEEGVELAPDAVLVGPLALGAGARVRSGARLIGPLVVGERSEIGPEALVRDSALGVGVRLGAGARVERSILIDGVQVAEATRLQDSMVAWKTLELGHLNLIERDLEIRSAALPLTSFLRARVRRRVYETLKRTFDVAFAAAASLALLPVMACVALAIRLDSKGPILFRQARCGRGGRKFQMLKFRSMRAGAEELQDELRALNESDGPVFKITNDPRLTRVGRVLRKYSLDELPQLWNVLAGDMSVVGPRPLAEEELRLCPSWREARLRVKPGLTGLWQVSSREKNTFNAWIRQDLRYVRNQSFLLDLEIVVRTVAALAKGL